MPISKLARPNKQEEGGVTFVTARQAGIQINNKHTHTFPSLVRNYATRKLLLQCVVTTHHCRNLNQYCFVGLFTITPTNISTYRLMLCHVTSVYRVDRLLDQISCAIVSSENDLPVGGAVQFLLLDPRLRDFHNVIIVGL